MLLMEIKNVLALVAVNMWPWESIWKGYSNTSGPQQEASDKRPAEKIEIWKAQGFLPLGKQKGKYANPTDFIRFLIYWPLRRLCWGLSFWWECLAVKVKHAKEHEMMFSKKDCISPPGRKPSNSPQMGAFQEPFMPRVWSPKFQIYLLHQNPLCWSGFICHSWVKMSPLMKKKRNVYKSFPFIFLLSKSIDTISDKIYQQK